MKKLFNAFGFACNGLFYVFKNERNFQIECCCAFAATALGLLFDLSKTEWLFCILNIGFVLSAELFNTAIEKLSDKVSKEIDPVIKIVKDTAAGAVMVSAFAAAVSGAVIFIPHIIHFIKSL